MKSLQPKKIIEEVIVEDSNEGLIKLMGKNVTFFGLNYIYTGRLVGVNTNFVKLENPKIVYETGPLNTAEWKDAQSLPNDFYINLRCVEAWGEFK